MKFFITIYFMLCVLIIQAQSIDSIINKNDLQQAVKFLSDDSLRGRLTGSKGAEKAAAYIRENFKNNLIHPLKGISNYFDSFKVQINRKVVSTVNVVGAIPSTKGNDSIVIICAHYDHLGTGNDLSFTKNYTRKDPIYNGANDNASGVAALISIAKYYAALKNNTYNIIFIAFSGEELGELGSIHFSKNITTNFIKTVINIDMIGRPDNEYDNKYNNKCAVITDNNLLIHQLNNFSKNDTAHSRANFFKEDNYSWESLFTRSDHYSFYGKAKNLISFMATSPLDKYYHTVKDEYNTIDFDFLLLTTRQIATACRTFIE